MRDEMVMEVQDYVTSRSLAAWRAELAQRTTWEAKRENQLRQKWQQAFHSPYDYFDGAVPRQMIYPGLAQQQTVTPNTPEMLERIWGEMRKKDADAGFVPMSSKAEPERKLKEPFPARGLRKDWTPAVLLVE